MKPILDLTKAIGDSEYYAKQFSNLGEDKNILFVNPQLSGKCLYKMILPFFSMFNEKVATAITGLSRYDYDGQIYGNDEIVLDDEMIEWADFIVFPFTTQPLFLEFYSKIKKLKKYDTKIVFLVDFNFYELSENHPYKKLFDDLWALSATEDNIWFADICLTSNAELASELLEKFKELSRIKYHGFETNLNIACMPYMIDTDIVLKNIEFDPLKPVLVNENEHNPTTKKHIEQVAEIAEVIKENNLLEKQSITETNPDSNVNKKEIISVNKKNNVKSKDNGNSKQSKQSKKRINTKPTTESKPKSAKPNSRKKRG